MHIGNDINNMNYIQIICGNAQGSERIAGALHYYVPVITAVHIIQI